jgi:hypothetical protein
MTTTEYPPRHIPGFRPLVPGEQWHRQDFTEDMLPDGWRPLMLGENQRPEDDELDCIGSIVHSTEVLDHGATDEDCHVRTRRPLPPPPPTFEHDGKTWNSHVPGDPCPVDGEKPIEVLLENLTKGVDAANTWFWIKMNMNSIIGYRIHDDEPDNDTAKLQLAYEGKCTELHIVTEDRDRLHKCVAELERQLANALTPRPIAEAGVVKEGFERIFFSIAEQGVVGLSGAKWSFATHFIDIKLPVPDPRAEYERAVAEAGGPFEAWLQAKGGAA